jgi:hypothetical protein
MYEDIIKKWNKSKKILFIYSEKKGCGKKYLSKQISKNYHIIKCHPKEIKKNDNIGINIMFENQKKKIVIYEIQDINLNDIKFDHNIKIIVIINCIYNINKLSKKINEHFYINIKLTDKQYVYILKKYIDYNNNDQYIRLLKLYDYNLNSILNNYFSKEKKTDVFYENSLFFLNCDKVKKYKIKDYFINPVEYSLSSLHILDYDKNIKICDKLKIYDSVSISENTKLNTNYYNVNVLFSLVIPHKIINKYDYKINYNHYISKSLIYINLINKKDKPDPNKIYDLIKKYKCDKNINLFVENIKKLKICKKRLKYIIKMHDLIHDENNEFLLKYF